MSTRSPRDRRETAHLRAPTRSAEARAFVSRDPPTREPDDPVRFRRELRDGLVDDATFDALYADPIRARSSRFWTPVAVAARAARLLARWDVRRVLDVGSGAGKFCLAAACVCPEVTFTGVEQRPHLVEAARLTGERLGLDNVRFVTGDVVRASWRELDGLYLYNPFAENVCDESERLDHTVELSSSRYMADVRHVSAALAGAPVGMCMVTYHGFGGPIPASYQLVHAERAHSDWLRVWVKRWHDDGARRMFYAEDGDDVLLVTSESGKARTQRIPCLDAVRRDPGCRD